MTIQKPQEKLYYSLRQVARMLDVEPGMIKEWENLFPQVKPIRNRADNRIFPAKDLPTLFLIRELLVEKRLPVETVQRELKNSQHQTIHDNPRKLKQILAEIKLEIAEIRELLNS